MSQKTCSKCGEVKAVTELGKDTINLQKHAKHPVDFMQQRGFLI